MAKRITVTALQPVQYDGRSHVRGSVFTTTPVDAASLKYRRKVKLGGQLDGGTVPEHPSITRRMEPVEEFQTPRASERVVDAVATAVEKDMTAEQREPPQAPEELTSAPAGGDQSTPPTRGRRGRTYQRRDMVAEREPSE